MTDYVLEKTFCSCISRLAGLRAVANAALQHSINCGEVIIPEQ